eukprot:gnl/TRDRNA2_/TRDRNA2_36660_c0_seq1.p1 gnl/TRDRNA2_/TRDRNA2_36660_c0~~gnl/TRDRNA2_/TRDRNA2_36660_c0_seq1.p1  ORF type:complete len:195 (-),score=44.18 gnl/TRDRNA2_/TRDRNA2_36660_c0_seq1:145-729(-)
MFFVDAPFPKKKEAEPPPGPATASAGAGLHDLPVDQETVGKNRASRVPYLEAREAVELEQKEVKAARAELGREIREACRPEIDEYIDCCVGRIWTMMACKPKAIAMRRCMKKIETPEYVDKRLEEIMRERESAGTSVVNNVRKGATRERRALYNKAINAEVDDPTDLMINSPDSGVGARGSKTLDGTSKGRHAI